MSELKSCICESCSDDLATSEDFFYKGQHLCEACYLEAKGKDSTTELASQARKHPLLSLFIFYLAVPFLLPIGIILIIAEELKWAWQNIDSVAGIKECLSDVVNAHRGLIEMVKERFGSK